MVTACTGKRRGPPKKNRADAARIRVCRWCNAEFDRVAVYCSEECRTAWTRKVGCLRAVACVSCGKQFSGRPGKKTCSDSCEKQHRTALKPRQTFKCRWCGVAYSPRNNNRDAYCGRPCYFAKKGFESVLLEIQDALFQKALAKRALRSRNLDRLRVNACQRCGRPAEKFKQRCAMCRTMGAVESRQRARRSVAFRALRKIKRKLAKYGGAYTPFTKRSIFERDQWVCQLCGITTDKKWSCDLNAPELDHVHPLSRGGDHTPGNAQLLCRACNVAKSNRIIGPHNKRIVIAHAQAMRNNTLPGGGGVDHRQAVCLNRPASQTFSGKT